MKKIIPLLISLILLISISYAAIWVIDPNNCPTEYNSVSCTGDDKVCGLQTPSNPSGSLPLCANLAGITAPDTPSPLNPVYTTSASPGYVFDCLSTKEVDPVCDTWYCNRNTSCYNTKHKETICSGVA